MNKITNAITSWHIAVCRPEPQAQQLVRALADKGYDAVAQPLFTLKAHANSEEIKQQLIVKQPSIVIFVSPAAVNFAQQSWAIKHWQNVVSQPITYIAVGKTTQKALQHCGIDQVIAPEQENSEGLLALPNLSNVAHKNILIVRGDNGRELLATTLTTRGAKITYIASYQKIWHELAANKFAQQWQKLKINAIVVTSVALLEKLVTLLMTTPTKHYWLDHCYWLVASERIAKQANQYNINNVINTCGASNQAIMTKISTMDLHND